MQLVGVCGFISAAKSLSNSSAPAGIRAGLGASLRPASLRPASLNSLHGGEQRIWHPEDRLPRASEGGKGRRE